MPALALSARDRHIIERALALAIAALDRVPDTRDIPCSDREDMVELLEKLCGSDVELGLYTASAERLVDKIRPWETA